MDYEKGYFKCCLDLYNYFESAYKNLGLKSKKQMQTFTLSLIEFLAKNHDKREIFRKYGGEVMLVIDPKTFEVKDIGEQNI